MGRGGESAEPSRSGLWGSRGLPPGTFQTEFGITCYTKGCTPFWLEEKMAHVAKYNASALGRMCGHYERSSEKHGYVRENIDNGKIGDNYNLAPARQEGQVAFINGRIEGLGLKRRPRENAVRMCDCVVTAPPEVSDGELRKFFAAESEALSEMFGAENLVSAWVHLDEPGARPHMHWAWVPVTDDGRLSAKEVVSKAALRDLHPALQQAADKALGHHVQVVLDDGKRAAEYVGMAEYKAATAEARRAAEKASAAQKAAETAERAQKAAEVRKRDSEAAAEASEKARKQAAYEAEAAKKDLETQRRRAKQLGPDGEGINWGHKAADGSWVTERHESSVGEVRAARAAEERLRSVAEKQRETAEADAMSAKLDAASARSEAEAWQAMVRDVQGISYKDEDGHERMGIAGMEQAYAAAQERLKAAQAAETVAVQQAQKAREDARAWRDKADLQQRRMGVRPMHLASALREMCRQMADVCLDLWRYARDAARRAWDRWTGEGLGKCADAFGVSYQDALDVAYDELEDRAYAHGMGRTVVDDLSRGPGVEQDQERGCDDWER